MHPLHTVGRIIVAVDQLLLRQGLRLLLSQDPHLEIVAEVEHVSGVVSVVQAQRPDVLLLDLDLPGRSGWAAVRAVQRCPKPLQPRVLLLASFPYEEDVRHVRELQVSGFVSKRSSGEQLRKAIHDVLWGQTAFDQAVSSILNSQAYGPRGRLRCYADGSIPLSRKEREVLREMIGDCSCKEIAVILERSYSTVHTQANRILDKLRVSSRQQAVLKAVSLGVIRVEEIDGRTGVHNSKRVKQSSALRSSSRTSGLKEA